jgi:uncharacterized membrane protein YoaK (UPF0700 family)
MITSLLWYIPNSIYLFSGETREGKVLIIRKKLTRPSSIDPSGLDLASAVCGLQNALATTYSGAIIRTTHVTGIFTDLGIMLGSIFSGEALDKRKAKLFLFIIFGFILGGTAGALLFKELMFKALLIPAFVCILMAVVYRVYSQTHS